MNNAATGWRKRFAETMQRYVDGGGTGALVRAFEVEIASMPLMPLANKQPWGAEVDELHREALRAYAVYQVGFASEDLENARLLCQSPIELAMLYALTLVGYEYCDSVVYRVETLGRFHDLGGTVTALRELVITPQAQIGQDRVDFLLGWTVFETVDPQPRAPGAERTNLRVNSHTEMVVECDGHNWHDRTKEQASADRARDRRLQGTGVKVFRYTGSDIWRDVFMSAKEALETIADE